MAHKSETPFLADVSILAGGYIQSTQTVAVHHLGHFPLGRRVLLNMQE